jgi:hypothetical protein
MIHTDILETIEGYTNEKYNCYEIVGDEERVSMTYTEMESMIEDLIAEIVKRDEKIKNIKQDIEDNYKPLTNKELYD